MCKLQIIKKVDSQIVSDIIYDCSVLLRLSINNVPYYLTIAEAKETILCEFTFFDNYDYESLPLHETSTELIYGKSTGRLYRLSIPNQGKKIATREWEQIKKEVSMKIPEPDFVLDELKIFLRVLQDSYTFIENS